MRILCFGASGCASKCIELCRGMQIDEMRKRLNSFLLQSLFRKTGYLFENFLTFKVLHWTICVGLPYTAAQNKELFYMSIVDFRLR